LRSAAAIDRKCVGVKLLRLDHFAEFGGVLEILILKILIHEINRVRETPK